MFNPTSWNQSIDLKMVAEDLQALVESGTYPAGNLPINGTMAINGLYNNYYPQYLILDCGGDETSNTFTFFGSDQSGAEYTFSIAGVNGTTVVIPIPYKIIGTDPNGDIQGYISMANPSSGTISVGITEKTATPWCQCDQSRPYFDIGVNVILTDVTTPGTLTYTLETTLQNAIKQVITTPVPDTTLNNVSTNPGATVLDGPTAFYRLVVNTWTDGYASLYSAQIGSAFSSKPNDRRPR